MTGDAQDRDQRPAGEGGVTEQAARNSLEHTDGADAVVSGEGEGEQEIKHPTDCTADENGPKERSLSHDLRVA